MKMKRFLSVFLALLLTAGSPMTALAANWYMEDGSVVITVDAGGQTVQQGGGAAVADDAPVITQRDSSTASSNTVTVNTSGGAVAEFTLQDVNLSQDASGGSAIEIGGSSANITLEGSNTLTSETSAAIHVSSGALTIDGDGSLYAEGGEQVYGGYYDGSAAIGSNDSEEMSGSITIQGEAQVKAVAKGENGAGIGSGYDGDLTGSITIRGDAQVEALSENQGVGIGSGSYSDLTGSITIGENAVVKAQGHSDSAGIGAGDDGLFSGTITIDGDANVEARSGNGLSGPSIDPNSSGIGTSDDGDFTGTIIIGGNAKVLAVGNDEGAGIGTADGEQMEGLILIRENAEVTAYAGDCAAAIGSEDENEVTGLIVILGQAKVKTGVVDDSGQLIDEEVGYIGDSQSSCHDSTNGHYILGPDVSINGVKGSDTESLKQYVNMLLSGPAFDGDPENLTQLSIRADSGGITVEASGEGVLEKVLYNGSETPPTQPGSYTVTCVLKLGGNSVTLEAGTYVIPAPTPTPTPERTAAVLFRVTDENGRDLRYKSEQKNGVLTVTADYDFAILTGSLSALETLKGQGVKELVFVTEEARSSFLLSDLAEKGKGTDRYMLTHDGETVTLTVGEKKTDAADILK